MPISFSPNYLAELAKNVNTPDIIIEVELDSGTVKYGLNAQYSDVKSCLRSATSFQNKLNPKGGYSTMGNIQFVLIGRDNFKDLIQDEFLKNRRVTKKEGFIADGFDYSDYADTFTGIISDWSRNGDVLTVTVHDDSQPLTKEIPVENATGTQVLGYSAINPVDIMTNIIKTRAGIDAARVDTAQFESERDLWLANWKYQRVITEPKNAKVYLNELQVETNSFVFHDGEKISYKVFAPTVPGQDIVEFSDNSNIMEKSVMQRSGYAGNFYNRVVFYYDWDESEDDETSNYDTVFIIADGDSQGASEWDETKTKIIKSKWIHAHTYNQTSNITGCVVYHCSKANGAGGGTLTYNNANKTLQWTAPSGSIGEAIEVDKDGKFTVYDANTTKYIRVLITEGSLPGSNKSDTITLTALSADAHASNIARKILNRYRDPATIIDFKIDLNHISNGGDMFKPTDFIDLTTDEACIKGKNTLNKEQMMLLSVKPDFAKGEIQMSTIQTKLKNNYGFISHSSHTNDWDAASDTEKDYGFIGDAANNQLGTANNEGFLII